MSGFIRWDEVWKATRHKAFHHMGEDPVARWDQRASEFNRRVMKHSEKAEKQIASLGLRPEDAVLDVGAGTGRLAIPIARITKSVTALDQSGGMLSCLKENMEKAGLTNIQSIQKNWMDVGVDEIPVHDVVISSNSLGVYDIQEALAKMDRLAGRSVHIFTFADHRRDDDFKEFLNEGKARRDSDRPLDYLIIYNLLADMGIYADLRIVEWESKEHFSSLDDAVSSWKEMREVPEEREPQLREFLSQKLVSDEQGLCMHRRSKMAEISWRKG